VEYVKQTYFIVGIYIFLIMLDLIVQSSGSQFLALSQNIKSSLAGASVVAFTVFVLNFLIQRKFGKLIPREVDNLKKRRVSPALKTFDQIS
jgi:hypothetical protein